MRKMQLDWPTRQGSKPVTTALNQAIFRAAALAANEELPDRVAAFTMALDECNKKKAWRSDYKSVIEKFVHIQAVASQDTVVQMCRAGLECASTSFILRASTGADDTDDASAANNTMTLLGAFAVASESTLETRTYVGSASNDSKQQFQLASPHGTAAQPLYVTGKEAVAQLEAWHTYGCMEESALQHAAAVCTAPNVSDYVTDTIFCLLGVTSEMGPTTHLLQIPGAHVMGVARAGPKLDALVDWFEQNGAPGATLQVTAADLLSEQIPLVAKWIVETAAKAASASNGRPRSLVLMPLAYMDGEANVRVTVAMDAIVQYVLQNFASGQVALAYLTSPTTIYTIPPEAAVDAQRRYEKAANDSLITCWTKQLAKVLSFGHWLQPSNTWKQLEVAEQSQAKPVVVHNGAYVLQGPNYCLAKMMQQWRCIVARYGSQTSSGTGSSNAVARTLVCAPHAPATRTVSVLHNSSAATAIEGMQYFEPLVTFDVSPCSSLLTAIVLNQLKTMRSDDNEVNDSSAGSQHPLEMFWDGSVHGGLWRCPYNSDSIVALTYVLGHTAKAGWCPAAALAPKPGQREVEEQVPDV